MTVISPAPRRRKPWIMAVPLLLVVVLGICWSGLWFFASAHAERELDAWVAREAMLGRVWDCKDRTLGGFPFRFELMCAEPSLTLRGTGDTVRITAAAGHAVAQVWAPNHMVAEFQGPAKVQDLATGHVYGATWSLLQMSGVANMDGIAQRFSLTVDNPAIQSAPGDTAQTLFTAKHFEAHARRTPHTSAGGPDGVDYAIGLVDGNNPGLAGGGGVAGPVNLVLQGSVTAIDNLQPMSLPERIKAWSAANGTLKVDTFSLTTPKAALTANGALGVDPLGRVFGAVSIGFSGVDELTRALAQGGIISPEIASIVNALALAGRPGDVAGRRGTTFSVTLKEGAVQLGKVPMGIIPPLF
ncbi:DUF2125 domain-containing protein [Aquabacter cavernae]|uniref:DUF2125 domain-containing protein n=1 Tax=Aquabacter cavernae TaxID=2496029 RepID=UPI000F8F5F18|nr:DUF2125 domain-containing protein [Aquabacter cavernae]